MKFFNALFSSLSLMVLAACASDRSDDILSKMPLIRAGMKKNEVYSMFGKPTNTDESKVAVWCFSGERSYSDWKDAIMKNGVFVVFIDDVCVISPLKNTESDPVSALRDARNLTNEEAGVLLK